MRVGDNAPHLGVLFAALVFCSSAAATPGDELRARIAAAAPGATIEVAPGVYDGPFVIGTPIRLVGKPGAILEGDRKTHVVAVRAPDVEIAGFTIRRSGLDLSQDNAAVHITGARAWIHDDRIVDSLHGIYVRRAPDCRIEHNTIAGDDSGAGTVDDPLLNPLKPADGELCSAGLAQDRRGNGIHLWNSHGDTVVGNTIRGTRDGIYFSFTSGTTVRDNTVTHVRYGLHYMYSDENTFVGNTFTDNAAGAALMYSKGLVLRCNRFAANRSHRAYGLLFQSVDDTSVEENEIEGNTLGFYLENSNHITVRANRIEFNYVGLRINDSTAASRFFENTFRGNLHPVETSGANSANTWSVAGRGNKWDAMGELDLDHDGIADLPHREPDLFGAWRRQFPAVGLLSDSPGERLLRFIHGRLALSGMPGVVDPHPLVHAPARGESVVCGSDIAPDNPAREPVPMNAMNDGGGGHKARPTIQTSPVASVRSGENTPLP